MYKPSEFEIARKMEAMKRSRYMMKKYNISVEKIALDTGVSESQVRNWMTPRGRNAPLAWWTSMCAMYDWSPTWINFGIGPETISGLKEGAEAFEHIVETLARLEAQHLETLEVIQENADKATAILDVVTAKKKRKKS